MNKLTVHVLTDPAGAHRWLVMDEAEAALSAPIAVAGTSYQTADEAQIAGESVMKNILSGPQQASGS